MPHHSQPDCLTSAIDLPAANSLPSTLASRLPHFAAAAVLVDAHGRIVQLNARAAELLGAECVGLFWESIASVLFAHERDLTRLENGTEVSCVTAEQAATGEQIVLLLEHQDAVAQQDSANLPGAVLAHQLRTPLSTAVLYVSRLACEQNLSAQHRQWLIRTQEQLTAAERMVDNLFMFAKQSAFATETLTLADIVNGARKSCEAQIAAEAMQCKVEVAATHLPVLGNRVALISAISNVITNACRHAPGTSLTVTARTSASNRGEICVRDTGAGFDDPQRAIAQPKTDSAQVSGLGLSIAKHVIEQHGGQLTATNHFEGGACVCVELPLAQCAVDSVEVSL